MFSNGNGVSLVFAQFNSKLGAFVLAKNADGVREQFTQIRDVHVTKVSTKEESYEGNPYTLLQLRLQDAKGASQVSFNTATGACAKMVSILNGADLSKPLGFSTQLLKAGTKPAGFDTPLENDLVSISVFQDGWLKTTAEVPKVTMVKVGSKDVADTTARDAFVKEQIAKLIAKSGATDTPESAAPAANAAETDDDSIPF